MRLVTTEANLLIHEPDAQAEERVLVDFWG